MTELQEIDLAKIINDFRMAYKQSYHAFLDSIKRMPCNGEHFKIALQHLDTASLWVLDGVSVAITKNFEEIEKRRLEAIKENQPNDSANCT